MKRFLLFCFFFAGIASYNPLSAQVPSTAGIVSMELNYAYLRNNNEGELYRINLTVYADCSFGDALGLPGAQPRLRVLLGGENYDLMKLKFNAAESGDASPSCSAEAGNTTCFDPSSLIPGVKKIVYSDTITLVGQSNAWRFRFLGEGINALRSQLIGNVETVIPLAFGETRQIYMETTVDNTLGPNSTPRFIASGAPYFCLNKPATYNMAAAEQDGDSVVYSLVSAVNVNNNLKTAPPFDAIYVPPFTPQAPLPASNFALDKRTGQLSFTPEQNMQCIVVARADEYRNGVKIGGTTKEMVFTLTNECNNDAPAATFSNFINAENSIDAKGNLTLTTCEGQTTNYGFDVNGADMNGDAVKISFDNLPTGGAITVDNNGSPNPIAHFTGNNNELKGGLYIFYVTITDDACPLTASKTMLCSLKVVPHNVVFEKGSTPSCVGKDIGKAWAVPSREVHTTYNYKWVNEDGTVVRDENSASGDTIRNIPAGSYKVYIRNDQGCGTNVVMEIDVLDLPVVTLPNDTTVCDRMHLDLSIVEKEYESYRWSTGATDCCIKATEAGTYTLTATNVCGSKSDDINISMVKCNYCLFIPNAFSPNGDGNNDVFKVIPTCLIANYKLQIYNRMGDMIYVSYRISDSWDGSYNGQQADMGTYYYHISATPEDDREHPFTEKGEITLIR